MHNAEIKGRYKVFGLATTTLACLHLLLALVCQYPQQAASVVLCRWHSCVCTAWEHSDVNPQTRDLTVWSDSQIHDQLVTHASYADEGRHDPHNHKMSGTLVSRRCCRESKIKLRPVALKIVKAVAYPEPWGTYKVLCYCSPLSCGVSIPDSHLSVLHTSLGHLSCWCTAGKRQ